MEFINEDTIKLDKVKTELDDFAFKFCRILEKHTKYVVVSGYVSILFGRARASEDIDIFIEILDKLKFYDLYKDLEKNNYECITADIKTALENLNDGIPIRFAKKGKFIPNTEIKFAKKQTDKISLVDNLKVITPFGYIFISHIEQQIAFKKICLGSNKDIEDALHLEKVFREHIDGNKIKEYEKRFKLF